MPHHIETPRRTGDRAASGRLARADTALKDRLASLERENEQLRQALHTRIVIEQAKGILAERFRLEINHAFELLRRAARSDRRLIHELAAEITTNGRHTPACVEAWLRRGLGATDAVDPAPDGERRLSTSNPTVD